jgi:redox-sensing transcriptional repressor
MAQNIGKAYQKKKINDQTIRRLSAYLRSLDLLRANNVEVTSSEILGEMEGINPSQVRRDLSFFGSFGVRGQGYQVSFLYRQITKILNLNRTWHIALIGAGQFSRVLLSSEAFARKNLEIVKIFDSVPEVIGKKIKEIPVLDINNLEKELDPQDIHLAIVAVPPQEVQSVIDRLGRIGIRGALYFASRSVNAPENMVVRNQDISIELGVLTYFFNKKHSPSTSRK